MSWVRREAPAGVIALLGVALTVLGITSVLMGGGLLVVAIIWAVIAATSALGFRRRQRALRFVDEVDDSGWDFQMRLRVHNDGTNRALLLAQVVEVEGGLQTLGDPPPWWIAGDTGDRPALRVPPGGQAVLEIARLALYYRRPTGELVWSGNVAAGPVKPSVAIALGHLMGGALDYAGPPIRGVVKIWDEPTDKLIRVFRFQIELKNSDDPIRGPILRPAFTVDQQPT